MRKFYDEFFRVSENEKIRENVMIARIITTSSIILSCLVAMSFTAYAYFSADVNSAFNTMNTASFAAEIVVTKTDSENQNIGLAREGKTQSALLQAGEYSIFLSKEDGSTGTGFCVLTLGDDSFYTAQIGLDADRDLTDATVQFNLLISTPTTIKILSHWGTSIYYRSTTPQSSPGFIENGDIIDLTALLNNINPPQIEETDQSVTKNPPESAVPETSTTPPEGNTPTTSTPPVNDIPTTSESNSLEEITSPADEEIRNDTA